MLVYDISKRESFNHVTEWLSEARTHGNPAMAVTLVGNKSDLDHIRSISYDEGERFSKDNGIGFIETSALKGNNIHTAFAQTAEKILEKIKDGSIDLSSQNVGVVVKAPQVKREIVQKGCCKS